MAAHEFQHKVYDSVIVVSDELKSVFDKDPNYDYVGVQGQTEDKAKAESKPSQPADNKAASNNNTKEK